MNEYFCEIKRGNIIVFSGSTTAVSPKKAINNIWYRYAISEKVPSIRVPIFVSQKKKELKCFCKTRPREPQAKPERTQLNLFDQMLNDTLATTTEGEYNRCGWEDVDDQQIDDNAHRR